MSSKIKTSAHFISSRLKTKPVIAVILGSGLGDFAESLENKVVIAAEEIPHYPVSTVKGHEGKLIFGDAGDVSVMAVKGRTHLYEGHDVTNVAFVVRIMAHLGIRLLIVTNAAGGVNPRFTPGDLMIISDHINFMFRNPLRGPVIDSESRWTDMHNAYDMQLQEKIEKIGMDLKIPLKRGVLFVSTGPAYESPAEVKMARKLGADALSMSTVPEVLVARANGIRVAGISCITNMATGISTEPLSHDEVTEVARLVKPKFARLLGEILRKIGKEY
ncbi:MAG: purine-nucleoside phosphorylase [Calditrichaeota bacterium]|nr:purine-nucleoside phosphorylase [Calditrichota bacterium]RQW08128.1 MAG: purine-nucleoside phosphorylase [Calditrichota bacterium]